MTGAPHLLIRAARGDVIERPPVWAMRQAGRWDPEFNKLRGNLSFYEFSENAELSAQATLLPRRFGVDAIILFYDITSLAVAMGLPFKLLPQQGPVPDRPIRSLADFERLSARPDPARFGHVLRVLELVKKDLAGDLPVLVFAGAPFTLASYCIGTGKDLEATRRFASEQPKAWRQLLDTLQSATIHFLDSLAQAGADAYQLFDSWAGELEFGEYMEWAQPRHQNIFAAVNRLPAILFVKECPYLELMVQSGANVVSLGVLHDLAAARRDYPGQAFQGNVDEHLLLSGTAEQVAEATRRCVEAGAGRRHIINLSHGVDKGTPPENFATFVKAAKGETRG
jgi:uroporphyrinogen decarboxylase